MKNPRLDPTATMPARRVPDFDLGDHVTIRPLESVAARVIAIEKDHDGWTIVCRYFDGGEAKTAKCFEDEVDLDPT
jgi:hypothetical protein